MRIGLSGQVAPAALLVAASVATAAPIHVERNIECGEDGFTSPPLRLRVIGSRIARATAEKTRFVCYPALHVRPSVPAHPQLRQCRRRACRRACRRPFPPVSVRIDKWLWAARFFKTRTLAQDAVAGGKIRANGERVKPAKEIKLGDAIDIRIGEFEWSVQVTALADKRGSAEVARTLYSETEASIARRAAQAADRSAQTSGWAERPGRPTKRDRREIDRWRGGE